MKSGDIGFKVVYREDRRSCSFHKCCGELHDDDKIIVRFYNNKSIITAEDGTLGLFIFNHKKDAENFLNGEMREMREELMVIKVRIRGRTRDIRKISLMPTMYSRRRFYRENKGIKSLLARIKEMNIKHHDFRAVPRGTFCVPRVEVLE